MALSFEKLSATEWRCPRQKINHQNSHTNKKRDTTPDNIIKTKIGQRTTSNKTTASPHAFPFVREPQTKPPPYSSLSSGGKNLTSFYLLS